MNNKKIKTMTMSDVVRSHAGCVYRPSERYLEDSNETRLTLSLNLGVDAKSKL
jgi:hypothetical protein